MFFDSAIFFLPLLVLAAIIGAIVYGVSVLRRRRGSEEDTGVGTVRRLYFYGVAFIALVMAANGLVQILQFILDSIVETGVISSRTRLAIGLSLAIIGLPVWAFHWRAIGRFTREHSVETGSTVRKVYVYLLLGVALGVGVAAAADVLRWIFGGRSFGGYPWAAIVVWTGVWLYHWRLESSEGQPTPEARAVRRLYLYIATLAMLVMGVSGLGRVVHILLLNGYDSLASVAVFTGSGSGLWRPAMRSALAFGLVGSTMWAVHWLRLARLDYRSVLRHVYVSIFATVGGTVTIMVAVGIVVYGVLIWLFGLQGRDTTADHFRFLPAAIATLAAGAGILGYHNLVARREAQDGPDELPQVRRFLVYITIAIGLGAAAVAVAALVTTAVGILGGRGGDLLSLSAPWRGGIALGITMGILGLPLWAVLWRSAQRRIGAGGMDELSSPARRLFIFAALIVGVLTLLGSASFVLFVFLSELLDGRLSEVVWKARVGIGIVAAGLAFLPYYWMVYRQDRSVEAGTVAPATAPRRRKTVTLLAADGAIQLVRTLEQVLDQDVRVLRWADPDTVVPDITEEGLRQVARSIEDAAGSNALLVPEETGFRVLSYH